MDSFIDELVKTMIQIAAPIVSALVIGVLVQIARKLGLEIGAEREAKLRVQAQAAILGTEEHFANLVKHQIVERVAPQNKLSRAAAVLIERVPGITKHEAERLITEELPKLGMGATSFLKSVRQAATTGPAA